MSRAKLLLSQPRTALGALLTLALATTAVVGSGADFTASSANPANTFAAGTLHIVNSKEGVAVLSGSGLQPGGAPAVGTVDLENDGSLSGAFQLSRGAPADSDATNPLSGKIDLTVVDCGPFAGATAPACGDGDDVPRYTGTLPRCPRSRSGASPRARSTASSSGRRSTARPATRTRAATRRCASPSTPPERCAPRR